MDLREILAQWFVSLDERGISEQRIFAEVDRRIRERFGSRRFFFDKMLPEGLVSSVTWGRWVSGKDTPRTENRNKLVPYLIEYLDLKEAVVLAESAVSLRSETEQRALITLALRASPTDLLRPIVDSAILQANEAEFPRQPSSAARRRHDAIRWLTLLAEALVKSDKSSHIVLGAEASVTIAMLLAEVGEHDRAHQYALKAAHSLDKVAEVAPRELAQIPVGYPAFTYKGLISLAYGRAATAMSNLGKLKPAEKYCRKAIGRSKGFPYADRLEAGLHRDLAKILYKQGRMNDAEIAAFVPVNKFGTMRFSDDPILQYVGLETMVRILVATERYADARELLLRGHSLEVSAHPGPIHLVLFAEREAELYHAGGEIDAWLSALGGAMDLAQTAGLQHQLQEMEQHLKPRIAHLRPSDHRLARPLLDRLEYISEQAALSSG